MEKDVEIVLNFLIKDKTIALIIIVEIKEWKLSSWQKTLINIMDVFFGIEDTRKKYVLIALNHSE